MENKKRLAGIFGLILVFSLIGIVFAATGLSSDYHKGNPVKVSPGETVNVVLGRLQNTGDKDLVFKIELIEGSEIATLTDLNLDNFAVSAGSLGTPLNIKISIPDDAAEGTEYEVKIRYKDITTTAGKGMVTMVGSSQAILPVLVSAEEVEEPEKEGIGVFWWTVIVVALIIVFWVVYKTLKRE